MMAAAVSCCLDRVFSAQCAGCRRATVRGFGSTQGWIRIIIIIIIIIIIMSDNF